MTGNKRYDSVYERVDSQDRERLGNRDSRNARDDVIENRVQSPNRTVRGPRETRVRDRVKSEPMRNRNERILSDI